MDPWLTSHLVCPRDRQSVLCQGDNLVCREGHKYPCVDGIPVMLLDDVPETHAVCHESLKEATNRTAEEGALAPPPGDAIDPFVRREIGGTCGRMYRNLSGDLTRYPIPDIRLPPGSGNTLLDIGCNWGRWTISAARKGYSAVGIDPSLEAIRTARRVVRQLNLSALFVVGDGRYLPFAQQTFDVVFSYSVLQHFDKQDCKQCLAEIGRTLKPETGYSLIQMPTKWGLHNLMTQARRAFRSPTGFEIRFWTLPELRQAFNHGIGPTRLFVDGFFCLDPQPTDLGILARRYRLVVRTSELLRKLSQRLPWMIPLADSVYLESACLKDPVVG